MSFQASVDLSSSRANKVARVQRIQDFLFHAVTQLFSLIVLFALLGIIVSLVINSWPALHTFGFGFFFTQEWDIVNGEFGGLIAIYGTLVTSVIALLIAVVFAAAVAVEAAP